MACFDRRVVRNAGYGFSRITNHESRNTNHGLISFLHRVACSFVNAACRMLWTVRKKVDRFSGANLYHGGIVLPGHVRLRERSDGMGAAIDRACMALSLSCGLHCTFTPLLIGLAAGLPIGWLLDESTEALLLAAAVLVNLRLCRQCARCEAEVPFA